MMSATPRSRRNVVSGTLSSFWTELLVLICSSLLAEWRCIAVQQCLRAAVHQRHTGNHSRNRSFTVEVLAFRSHCQDDFERVDGRERLCIIVEIDRQRDRVSRRVIHGEDSVGCGCPTLNSLDFKLGHGCAGVLRVSEWLSPIPGKLGPAKTGT